MRRASSACALMLLLALAVATPARAATVVTDCSDFSGAGGLRNAVEAGGPIIFACDGEIVTQPMPVLKPTSIDADGHDVVLDGNGATIFRVVGTDLSVKGVDLRNARGSAIYALGAALTIEDAVFESNLASATDLFRHEPKGSTWLSGGAIHAQESELTVTGSRFSLNAAADDDDARNGSGGAIAVYDGAVAIRSSEFAANQTRRYAPYGPGEGGAVYVEGSSLSIEDSTFTGNAAGRAGGAVYAAVDAMSISESAFERNVAGWINTDGGGGALSTTSPRTTIGSSRFTNNGASGSGGSVHAAGHVSVSDSTFVKEGSDFFVVFGLPRPLVGGAIAAAGISASRSTFDGNFATTAGGALFAETVEVSDSTLTDNTVEVLTTLVNGEYGGGAIFGQDVSVTRSAFTENATRASLPPSIGVNGGAIRALQAAVSSSTFSFNSAMGDGGAIAATTATIETTTFERNQAQSAGGAVFAAADAAVDSSTFAFNGASSTGGGLDTTTARVANSTFYGNNVETYRGTPTQGGFVGGGAALAAQQGSAVSTTFADNGGIGVAASTLLGQFTLTGSIVSGHPAAPNCSDGVVDGGHNIDSGSSCGFSGATSMSNTDPMLRGLADNGGPTRTVGTKIGSPAIDAGDPATCPAVDQRGVKRLRTCDIGSFENRSA